MAQDQQWFFVQNAEMGMDPEDSETTPPDLITCLRTLLGNTVSVYFRAHGYHWNVKGTNFAAYHEFFQEIYEDIYASIDDTAEWLRKLDVDADYQLSDFINNRDIQDTPVKPWNAIQMVKDLYDAVEALDECTEKCLELATTADEQGLINFLGGRIDMLEKWEWQLKATFSETL
jgi:starvation-inducible DNA-binding protein